jgi:hypothetical protein
MHLTQMYRRWCNKTAVTGLRITLALKKASNYFMHWVMWRLYFGKFLNIIGFPASINKCDYRSDTLGVTVKVEHRDLFTVITVNGLDVYFKRISGKIDGVGISQASYCTTGATLGLADLGALPFAPPPLPQKQNTLGSSG